MRSASAAVTLVPSSSISNARLRPTIRGRSAAATVLNTPPRISGCPNFAPCAALGYTSARTIPINFFKPNPFANNLNYQDDNGDNNYNGLQVELRKQLSRGLMANVAYTWSHMMGTQGNTSSDGAATTWSTAPTRPRSVYFDVVVEAGRPGFDADSFRQGLQEALVQDPDLLALGRKQGGFNDHARFVGVGVEQAVAVAPAVAYRVRIDFKPDGWIDRHGKVELQKGADTCTTCHGASFCAGCHERQNTSLRAALRPQRLQYTPLSSPGASTAAWAVTFLRLRFLSPTGGCPMRQ